MKLLIVNCNHWVGFHITNAFLGEDYSLDAIVDKNIDNDLELFFGRNSNLNFIDNLEKKYEASIIIGDHEQREKVQASRTLIVQVDKEIKVKDDNITVIRPPLLFGEWMPMDEKGFYRNNRFITFDSNDFRNNALSIHIFTSLLLKWLTTSSLPKYLDISSNDKNLQQHSIYIRQNESIEDQLDNLKQHYKKYRNFYHEF